jgi:hypothetical protein
MDGLSPIDPLSSSKSGTSKLFQYAPSAASVRKAATTSTRRPATAPGTPAGIVGLGARLMGAHAGLHAIGGKTDFAEATGGVVYRVVRWKPPTPKSCSFYIKVAKSAKKLTTSNSFFADLATFV